MEGPRPSETEVFFQRPVEQVASDLSREVTGEGQESVVNQDERRGMVIEVTTPEGELRLFEVTKARPYREEDASPIWKGIRLAELREEMNPGEAITFKAHTALQTFVKASDNPKRGDNILIEELRGVSPEGVILSTTGNTTQVSKALGFEGSWQHGTLEVSTVNKEHLIFTRSSVE